MLREAELFEVAESTLVEVLGRIRTEDRHIVLPPLSDLPGAEAPTELHAVTEAWIRDDAGVPAVLGGASTQDADPVDAGVGAPDLPDEDRRGLIARTANAAIAAARNATDGDAIVHAPYADLSTRDYLLRLAVNRSLVAHYVAAYLGSTACPLPEELARPLWELTAPDAAAWRALGVFRDPLPIPDKASWRDTFLRTGGHEPHPLGH